MGSLHFLNSRFDMEVAPLPAAATHPFELLRLALN